MSAPARKAPEKLIRAVTKLHSASEAYRVLTGQGYSVTLSQCSTARSVAKSRGEASVKPAKPVRRAVEPQPIRPHIEAPCTAKLGSDALLKAIDRLYDHYALTRRCSVPAARLALNYSPAQLRKMAA